MLVLGRRKCQSVVIGDEITLTVEEICDSGDGQRIFGATVRLGFESPRYVSIYRSELRDRKPGGAGTGRAPQPPQRPGELVPLSDAQVRLRIQVPQKVPVCHNGSPAVASDAEEKVDGDAGSSGVVYHLTCRKEDRIAICRNITIAALEFHRFVASEENA